MTSAYPTCSSPPRWSRVSWGHPRSYHWHPAGSCDHSKTTTELHHYCSQLPQCQMQYWPLTGWQQRASSAQANPLVKAEGTPMFQCCQDIIARLMWAYCWLHWSSLEWLLHRQCWREMEPHPCCYLQLCHGHLQQEREEEPRLVWRRDCWTRASDYSQESSAGWVQEGPLREVTCCTKESQEWCPVDCLMLH